MNNFDSEFEDAIRFLADNMPAAKELEKPTLFHSIRVGVYLYLKGYSREVCIAGLLHDLIEDSQITKEEINNKFGNEIADIVFANTKNKDIENTNDKYNDQILRCTKLGESALIVKAADIIDNYNYYTRINEKDGLKYVQQVSKILLESKPELYKDSIFEEIRSILE